MLRKLWHRAFGHPQDLRCDEVCSGSLPAHARYVVMGWDVATPTLLPRLSESEADCIEAFLVAQFEAFSTAQKVGTD